MENSFSILIIEDDVLLNDMTKRLLTQHGYCVTSAYSGSEALLLIEKSSFDLILLDLMLPGIPGEIVLDKIKSMMDIPIIGVSAKTDIDSKVNLIRNGADDYITKPFGIMEFLSRVRAALRRSAPEERQNVYAFHEILLDNARHSVTVNGTHVDLTYKEYSLLRLLLENTNLVVTRETILQVVWGTDISVESRTVDMHIRTLRKKLGDAGRYICTVRKVGYKLADSEEGEEE